MRKVIMNGSLPELVWRYWGKPWQTCRKASRLHVCVSRCVTTVL